MNEKNNNHITDIKQLAETGWQQMHKMLIEHGMSTEVTSPASSSKKRNWSMLMAAVIFLFIIFSYPFILNDKHLFLPGIAHSEHSSPPGAEKFIQATESRPQPQMPKISNEGKALAQQKIKADYLKFRRDQAITLLQDQVKFIRQKYAVEKIANTTLPKTVQPIDTLTRPDPSLVIPGKTKNKAAGKMQLFAGAGINISEGDKNSFSLHNFNIHPGLTLIIPVTKKLSLHTGLWAFATLHKKEASTKERQLVNTISGNPYYDVNTTSIVKASYFDLPLTVHYSLSPNWSVGSGIQLSKLYRINIKEKKESYDYNNLLFASSVDQVNSTPGRAAALFQKKVEIKQYEPRLVLETNFNYNNWLFSAGYYYGLAKTITLKDANNLSRQYRNEYFKCGIQYRIRWKN